MGEEDAETYATFSDFGLPAGAGYDVAVRGVLHEEEGVFILDDAAAEARRATLFALQEALFGDDADA